MLDLMSAIDTSNVKPAGVLSLLGALRSPKAGGPWVWWWKC